MGTRSRKWILVFCIAALVFAAGYGVYRARLEKEASSETVLATAIVERRSIAASIQGKGTVDSPDKRQIKAKSSGSIVDIRVAEGTLVGGGDTLAILSNDALGIQLEKARFNYETARKTLDLLLSPEEKGRLELDLKEAQMNLDRAQEKVSSLIVTAPIPGVVWDLNVEPGDNVRQGQVLGSIFDVSSYLVTARVKQNDLDKLRKGSSVQVHAGGDIAPVNGVVQTISDEGSNTGKGVEFEVEVRVDEPSPLLKPGMSVTVVYNRDDVNLSLLGQIKPLRRKDLIAQTDGKVDAVFAKVGSSVNVGHKLLAIRNDEIPLALERAKRNLDDAQKSLVDLETRIEKARLDLKEAQWTLEQKEKDVEGLTIKSPIAGKIISVSAKKGEEVSAGQTLFVIHCADPLIVTIQCDELDIRNVYPGQEAKITIDGLPGETFSGKVRRISQTGQVRDGVTNYAVEVEFRSEKAMLSMSSTVSILVSEKNQVLAVPLEAIKWEGQKAYVYSCEGNRVIQKRVTLGTQDDMYVEIVSGLKENEMVLTGDLSRINDVSNVRLPNQVPRIPFRPR